MYRESSLFTWNFFIHQYNLVFITLMIHMRVAPNPTLQ